MAAPALCVGGMALGSSFVEGTRITPHPYDEHIGYVGLRMIDVSVLVFLVVMVGFCVMWLVWTWKNRPKVRQAVKRASAPSANTRTSQPR